MHLIQTNENAFVAADQLIKIAAGEGVFDNVTILPAKDKEPVHEYQDEYEAAGYSYHANGTMYIPSSSHNLVLNLYNRTKDTIHRSYQKLFTRLAS